MTLLLCLLMAVMTSLRGSESRLARVFSPVAGAGWTRDLPRMVPPLSSHRARNKP